MLRITTSSCVVTVNGRLSPGRDPALLLIRGYGAPQDAFDELLDALPDAPILLGDLPGMWSAPPETANIETFATAYDEVVATALPERPIVVMGSSVGALVALGMKSPQIVSRILIEPFFRIAPLWPLIEHLKGQLRLYPDDTVRQRYIGDLFGVTPEGDGGLEFWSFLDTSTGPLSAIVGNVPLGSPRSLATWPSFSDEETVRRLSDYGASVCVVEGAGHNIRAAPKGLEAIVLAARTALAEAASGEFDGLRAVVRARR